MLFSIAGYPVKAYGLFVALAHLAGVAGVCWQARRRGDAIAPYVDIILAVMLSGLLGARLAYVLEHPAEFPRLADLFSLERGGLSFFGGLSLAVPAFFLTLRRHRLPFRATADSLAPVLPFSLGLIRLGCFAAGCCHGAPTDLPWGVHVMAPWVPEDIRALPLHPSPLYEALFLFTLSGTLLYAQRLRPAGAYHGRLAALCLGAYGVFRFGFDFLRGDLTPLAAGLAPSQWFGIAVALVAVVFARPFGERPR